MALARRTSVRRDHRHHGRSGSGVADPWFASIRSTRARATTVHRSGRRRAALEGRPPHRGIWRDRRRTQPSALREASARRRCDGARSNPVPRTKRPLRPRADGYPPASRVEGRCGSCKVRSSGRQQEIDLINERLPALSRLSCRAGLKAPPLCRMSPGPSAAGPKLVMVALRATLARSSTRRYARYVNRLSDLLFVAARRKCRGRLMSCGSRA